MVWLQRSCLFHTRYCNYDQKLSSCLLIFYVNILTLAAKVRVMVSEENDEAIIIDGLDHARYCVVFGMKPGAAMYVQLS